MTITDDTVRTLQRHTDAPELNAQEMAFCAAILTGANMDTAAKAAGVTRDTGYAWIKRPHIAEFIRIAEDERRSLMARSINYTIEDAHLDIEAGKRMASTATEWFKGVELHMKLHGLGQKKEVEIRVDSVHRVEQLQQISDEDLLRLAGAAGDSVFPDMIEAEFEEVYGE